MQQHWIWFDFFSVRILSLTSKNTNTETAKKQLNICQKWQIQTNVNNVTNDINIYLHSIQAIYRN